MSRTNRRNLFVLNSWPELYPGGRVPIIRRDCEKNVSHSHACYLCTKGTIPKRIFHTKPRRRREKAELRRIVRNDDG